MTECTVATVRDAMCQHTLPHSSVYFSSNIHFLPACTFRSLHAGIFVQQPFRSFRVVAFASPIMLADFVSSKWWFSCRRYFVHVIRSEGCASRIYF